MATEKNIENMDMENKAENKAAGKAADKKQHATAHAKDGAASHSHAHSGASHSASGVHSGAGSHSAGSHAAGHSAAHAGSHSGTRHVLSGKYTEAVGRRKTAVARVRIASGSGKMTVNDKDAKHYFNLPRLLAIATAPLRELNLIKQFDASVSVHGGGISAQAEAVRHGVARAIIGVDVSWKPRLRAAGYVTRDPRMVERKKYGKRKARRAPQWAKR